MEHQRCRCITSSTPGISSQHLVVIASGSPLTSTTQRLRETNWSRLLHSYRAIIGRVYCRACMERVQLCESCDRFRKIAAASRYKNPQQICKVKLSLGLDMSWYGHC